jgi:hypothetical protein
MRSGAVNGIKLGTFGRRSLATLAFNAFADRDKPSGKIRQQHGGGLTEICSP